MLIENLYQFENLSEDGDKITSDVIVNANSSIFEGHFPNQPITPGVMQLDLVKGILESATNKSYSLENLNRCKFLAIWDPSEMPKIKVELTLKEIEEGLKVSAIGKSEEKNIFKFSALYK